MARFTTADALNFNTAFKSTTLGALVLASLQLYRPPAEQGRMLEEFAARTGQGLPTWLGMTETSAAGTPTTDYVADAVTGVYAVKFDTTNEVETITVSQGDQRTWDIAKNPIVEFRLKVESDVTGGGGVFAAGDKCVFGLAHDRNATLDDNTVHAWFMFAGANHNVYVETDDGTTDNDDNDTSQDWAENTFARYKIDTTDQANIKFYINDIDVTPETMTLAAATGNLQVYAECQKAAALNKDHRLSLDYIIVDAER